MKNCILNKIFTGSYIEENLGHDIINFIKNDNGERLVYVMRNGKVGPKSSDCQYVFHIMKTSICDKYEYQVVALSEVDHNKINSNDETSSFLHGLSVREVFYNGRGDNDVENYTFIAKKLYLPQKTICVATKRSNAKVDEKEDKIIVSTVSNPLRSFAYAENDDFDALESVVKYMVECDKNLIDAINNNEKETAYMCNEFKAYLTYHFSLYEQKLESLE